MAVSHFEEMAKEFKRREPWCHDPDHAPTCSCSFVRDLEYLLRSTAQAALEQGGRDWQEKAAADGRYLPHHSVGWLVVNGEVCRKRHTDFVNDPCVFEPF